MLSDSINKYFLPFLYVFMVSVRELYCQTVYYNAKSIYAHSCLCLELSDHYTEPRCKIAGHWLTGINICVSL
jgi:hypothetical protein